MPLIVELEQVHRCISLEVSDRLKDVRIIWIATIGSDQTTVSNLFEIPTEGSDKTITKLKEHPDVVSLSVLQIGPSITQIIIREKKEVATAPFLAKTGVAWLAPALSEEGVDKVTMIAPDFSNLRAFIDLVSEKGYDIHIKSKRYLDGKSAPSLETFRSSGFSKLKLASEILTDRQMEAFDLACRHGYYEEPKRITIEELALKLGISQSTCAELLRKSEKKLLPVLNDVLRLIR